MNEKADIGDTLKTLSRLGEPAVKNAEIVHKDVVGCLTVEKTIDSAVLGLLTQEYITEPQMNLLRVLIDLKHIYKD